MNRRTIITIIIGIVAALLLILMWFWFFGTAGTATPNSTGTFGSGGNRTGSTAQTTGPATNIPSTIGQTVGSGGVQSSGSYVSSGSGVTVAGSGATTTGSAYVAPGVNWLSGNSTGGGSGTTFTPANVNQLNSNSVGGTVNVLGSYTTPGSSGGGNSSIAAGLLGATAIGCLVFMAPSANSLIPSVPPAVPINNGTQNNKTFMDCLARTIARAAVQQITASIVNWINSGFNGSPSFITNYQQFFNNVADSAAGSFIQNLGNFAPYCTPFRTQIQIALANSYARRNTAQSCTLTQLLGVNIFKPQTGRNGWGNLVSFTSNPSNNPYGAYMSAQAQLQGTLGQATQNANRNISPGGFLNFQQAYDCKASGDGSNGQTVTNGTILGQQYGTQCPSNCKCKVSTPGATIQDSLSNTLKISSDTLTQAGISGSFDAIISALITQLTTRALQGGVSNLSGTTGYASYYYTPDQQAAQTQGQTLLTTLQGFVSVAQQFGQSEQGAISDIQSAQSQLNGVANCWTIAASSTDDVTKQNIALSDAASANTTLHSYDGQVTNLNARITAANGAIAELQNLQTQTLNIASTANVSTIQTQLDSDIAQGVVLSQSDLTQAQQDRTTLQSQLASLNISAQLQQCNAFH